MNNIVIIGKMKMYLYTYVIFTTQHYLVMLVKDYLHIFVTTNKYIIISLCII